MPLLGLQLCFVVGGTNWIIIELPLHASYLFASIINIYYYIIGIYYCNGSSLDQEEPK